jgi:putative endonuclease
MWETPDRQLTGKCGEDVACKALERRGDVILARRYRTRFGEIDIVSQHAGTIVFTEVKARRTNRYGPAAEQIPVWKQRRIAAMALDYLAYSRRLNDPCRFDVVAIDGAGTTNEKVNVIESAFLAH